MEETAAMIEKRRQTEASYDRIAQQYTDEYFDELLRKPFDRELLDSFAQSVRELGEVCEIGCGPGHIARYLQDRGVKMFGVDLSQEMVNCARRFNPDISFSQGDMLKLGLPDEAFAGVVSFYAIIHLARKEITSALKEMRRVLRPSGKLLLSFHGGDGELHRDEWYGQPVSIDVTFITGEEMRGYLEAAGFTVEEIAEREPYTFEYPTPRLYALAQRNS